MWKENNMRNEICKIHDRQSNMVWQDHNYWCLTTGGPDPYLVNKKFQICNMWENVNAK